MIDINNGSLIEGNLPGRALRMVQEWAIMHKEELLFNFNSLSKGLSDWKKITPLD